MLHDIREFLLGGRVLDLAVGIMIGVAFGTLIRSLVTNLVTPLLAIGGDVDFAELAIEVGGSELAYGQFLNDLLAFLVVALSVYLLVVRPLHAMKRRAESREAEVPTTTCEHCLSTIPVAATRCAFCTGVQSPPALHEVRPDAMTTDA